MGTPLGVMSSPLEAVPDAGDFADAQLRRPYQDRHGTTAQSG
jgi:hypothetical protein